MFCGITGQNLAYALDYDYVSSWGCYAVMDGESEQCDDLHRCGTISNIEVLEVSISDMATMIFEETPALLNREGDAGITLYVIDRLLRAHKVYEPENWYVYTTRGYYGDEIGGATYEGDRIYIEDDLRSLATLNDTEATCLALEREYGDQPDWADELTVESTVLEVGEIDVPSTGQLIRATEDPGYNSLDGTMKDPRDRRRTLHVATCLVRRTGKNRYVLVDGHHRWVHDVVGTDGDKVRVLLAS